MAWIGTMGRTLRLLHEANLKPINLVCFLVSRPHSLRRGVHFRSSVG